MSSATASLPAARARREALLGWGMLAFALYHLSAGVLMALDPHDFYTQVGPFGARNDHYIRDVATYNLAFGVALLVASRRRSWRVPLLSCVVVQFALHSLNHLLDIGASHPAWLGPADFISLTLATALLGWLLRESLRQRQEEQT